MRGKISVKGFVVVQVASRDPAVVLGAITGETNQEFMVAVSKAFVVDDLLHEKFQGSVDSDWARPFESAGREFAVVILFERLDVGCMEGREKIGSVGDVKSNSRCFRERRDD